MAKGYICKISTRRDQDGFAKWIDAEFDSKKEAACYWSTKQDAENEAGMLEHHDVAITTAEGQRHVCKGYQVEERATGEFIICCEAPFVQRAICR
jgi:hypothetical protein